MPSHTGDSLDLPDLSAKFPISNLERLTAAFSCLGRPRAFEHATNRAVKFPNVSGSLVCESFRIQSRTCISDPPAVAQGGRGVVVAGCPTCRKRINTMTQFLDHLTNDAMPELIDRLSTQTCRKDE